MRVTRHERKAIFQHLKKLHEVSALICFSFLPLCPIPESIFSQVQKDEQVNVNWDGFDFGITQKSRPCSLNTGSPGSHSDKNKNKDNNKINHHAH